MKTYIAVTGVLFTTVSFTHVVRAFLEDGILRDPWFVTTTALAVALAVWAIYLLLKRSSAPPAA